MPFRLIHAVVLEHKIIRQVINRITREAINSARITNKAEEIIKTGRTRPIKTNLTNHDMDNGFSHPKNIDAGLAQGHYQAQNFFQINGEIENSETLNTTGGSQYMHYTKIICH